MWLFMDHPGLPYTDPWAMLFIVLVLVPVATFIGFAIAVLIVGTICAAVNTVRERWLN